MLRHHDIWRGLDELAARHGLSVSGLARQAGLDPTAFNRSKRVAKDGRPRWPSTESVARALQSVGAGFSDLAALIEGRGGGAAPLIGFAQAGADGYFDDAGFPVGEGWEEVRFPGMDTDAVYALQITGRSMEPVYREGDRIVVAPGEEVRRGDRVVAKTADGEVMAKVLGQRNGDLVELLSINPEFPPRRFAPGELAWIARIVWVSQ